MKKQISFSLLFAVLMSMTCIKASAHDFEVVNADGKTIYYIYNYGSTGTTVSVSYKGYAYYNYSDEYSGDIIIPESVTYNGTTYSVTSIDDDAFSGCRGLTSVTIPNSVTSIGSSAFYDTGWYNNQPDGILYLDNCLIGYKGKMPTGILDIEEGTRVIAGSAFRDCSGLTSVTIPNSVTTIDKYAFYGCSGLTSVTIPNSVTTIGQYAFYGTGWYNNQPDGILYLDNCLIGYKGEKPSGIVNIVDGTRIIADYAFADCSGLTSVNIPNSVTSIGGYAFYNCSSLTSITIPNSVTSIGGSAFSNCSGITSVTIPNSVTSIGGNAFSNCSGITSVTIPNSVTSIGDSAFEYCSSLTSVTIPNSVTNIGRRAFTACSGLTSVTIGNSVTSIGYKAFYYCSGLTSVTIPNSVTSIGNSAFNGCSSLHSVIIGSGVTSIGDYAFSSPQKTIWLTNTPPSGYSNASGSVNYVSNNQFSSLSNVIVYQYLSSYFEVDGVTYVPIKPSERTCDAIDCAYNKAKTIINIPSQVTYKGVALKVKKVQPYLAYNNQYIESLTLDNEGDVAEYSFSGCSKLQTATIGDKVSNIGDYSFNACSSLQAIAIPDAVTSIGSYAFQNCSSMVSANFGKGLETISQYAFDGCAALTGITIPNAVTTIGNYVFNSCSGLKNVTIEDREAELSLGSNGSSPLFSSCPLDEVYIGGDIKYNASSSYGYSPFYRNTSLRSITITDKETEISENEFYGCTNLQDVSIGDGVTTIANRAFSGCSSLKSFAFGTQLQTIGNEAFSDCSAMSEIVSKAQTPPVCGSQALDDINKWECKLYVPDGTLAAYQAADQWMDFFFAEEGEGSGGPAPVGDEKCATPTISYKDGKIYFDCETSGVQFHYNIIAPNSVESMGNAVPVSLSYTVKVYATKNGYIDSDLATTQINVAGTGIQGDVNQDGVVSITDAVSVVNIILNGNAAAPAMDMPQELDSEATPE